MSSRIVRLGTALVAGILVAGIAAAGGHASGRCGGTAAGMAAPCGDGGCGPRVWGPWHGPCDPCDGCGRWRGCNGARQQPDRLAPWQQPPGCGFTRPADLGYERPVGVCGAGAACDSCSRHQARCF